MTPDEAAFQSRLDADPSDSVTRLVFADWLDEQDPPDPRGPGYRALGLSGKYAYRVHGIWTYGDYKAVDEDYSDLPRDWFVKVVEMLGCQCPGADFNEGAGFAWYGFNSRRDADNPIALAFARLPAQRRAELLATVETPA